MQSGMFLLLAGEMRK